MPAPSIPRFNGQIKTPWRGGYTSTDQLAQNSRECYEDMLECQPFRLIWKAESLMPFQFIRPFSMSLVTSWKLYDGPDTDATEVVDLTGEIDKLRYDATNLVTGTAVQYVTYLGTPLDAPLEAGTYYMRIVSGGITYYWEPLLIVCDSFGTNLVPADPFADGLATVDNPATEGGFVWSIGVPWGRLLTDTKNTAGDPTDPALEVEGTQVANFGDGLIYRYLSGVWVSASPPASNGWYDYSTGDWYQTNGSVWSGMAFDPLTLDENGACWRGTANVPITLDVGAIGCTDSNMRFTIAVTGMTTGSMVVSISDTAEGVTITSDGEYTFDTAVSNGYLLELTPTGGFDGCVSSVQASCASDVSDCFYRLDWSNCGNVGNTYLTNGFTHSMYFERVSYPVNPTVETTVKSQQLADGSIIPTSRRRETTWEIIVGLVPWYVADALSDLSLYDHVELRPYGGGADVLTGVEVSVENDEDFAPCWKTVRITFQIDASAVTCCDDFAPPCKSSCADVAGYITDVSPVEGLLYLIPDASAYATRLPSSYGPSTECASGIADIFTDEVFDHTVYFDLNNLEWVDLAIMGDVTVTPIEGGCTLNILALIPEGYSAVLQYLNTDDEWITDDTYNLTAAEWADNVYQRETPADQNVSNTLRLMIYVDGIGTDGRPTDGRCEVGFSVEFDYVCE